MRDQTCPPACLLLHGFGGSPFEMEPLVEPLAKAGFETRLPTLPGHDSTMEEFCKSRFEDWSEAALAAYQSLERPGRDVFVIGLSMGGTLGLRVAARHNPAGVVAIAPPVYLYRFYPWEVPDWRIPILVPLARLLRPVWPLRPPSAESRAIAPWRGYDQAMSVRALASFLKGIRAVRAELPLVRAPLAILYAPTDKSCPPSNAWDIARRVSSGVRRIELLPIEERVTSHHVLTTHRETRHRVREACLGFLREITLGRKGEGLTGQTG